MSLHFGDVPILFPAVAVLPLGQKQGRAPGQPGDNLVPRHPAPGQLQARAVGEQQSAVQCILLPLK